MASNKGWGLIMAVINELTSGRTVRSKNPKSKRSADNSDPTLGEAREMLRVAAEAAENIEMLLGAIDKQMASHGIFHRDLIHMVDFARRLVAAQRDLLTSKRSGNR